MHLNILNHEIDVCTTFPTQIAGNSNKASKSRVKLYLLRFPRLEHATRAIPPTAPVAWSAWPWPACGDPRASSRWAARGSSRKRPAQPSRHAWVLVRRVLCCQRLLHTTPPVNIFNQSKFVWALNNSGDEYLGYPKASIISSWLLWR